MYTITTSVQEEGGLTRNVVTRIEGSLSEVWAAHKDTVKAYGGITYVERVQEEKHPLEPVLYNSAHYPGAAYPMGVSSINTYFAEDMRHAAKVGHRVAGCVQAAAARVLLLSRKYTNGREVIRAAILQATKGKGQRHGGDKTPFLEQPWVRLYKTHGLGFLLGQADKKYHEACGKENKEDAEREFLGAIVYLGMALLVLEGKVK